MTSPNGVPPVTDSARPWLPAPIYVVRATHRSRRVIGGR